MATDKEIKAAALGIDNPQRAKHGLDSIEWDCPALTSWHLTDALAQARAALTAAEQVRASIPVTLDGYSTSESGHGTNPTQPGPGGGND